MNNLLDWALVFHILGIVFWLGGLLIITHVLAADTEASSEEAHEAFGRLEASLFKGIAHPGAAIVILSGLVMMTTNPHYYVEAPWLRVKLILVAVLVVLDFMTYRRMQAFRAGRLKLQRKQCMVLHGAIALVFIGILVMVLIQPF
ncbi:MAG TPA: CopD family protein [Terriglobia bacterium]|nr:CopD family protein [Terriglobia bacterium]